MNFESTPGAIALESNIKVPFFRPDISQAEIDEVVDTLQSGWLTTGPKTKRFEADFARAVGAEHAVALNSCTAALHLAVLALGLSPGQAVLVPTMTFAASAEIILYTGAIPILVDCDPTTGNIDLADAERKLNRFNSRELPFAVPADSVAVGIIPVHVGGMMINIGELKEFAERHGLWVVEDAAHAFPAAWRINELSDWQHCGNETAAVTCYSFYANKTITTGEGGMAVTNDARLADEIRLLSLHGLSHDAWGRFSGNGAWDYRIITAGYKYNLTDIASAIGIHQLARAEEMRTGREKVANRFLESLAGIDEIDLPPFDTDRIHSWHLFPIRLNLEQLKLNRNEFIDQLRERGVGYSVHWRPLHLHPLYGERFNWKDSDLPVATELWQRLVSLPIFSSMTNVEVDHVIGVVKEICVEYSIS